MFYVLLLLFVCTVLAYLSANKKYAGADNSNKKFSERVIDLSSIAFVVLLIILVCFSGLRTYINDTASYISSYEDKILGGWSGIQSIDWSLGSNPLFQLYQVILKTIFSANGQMFIFLSSLITVSSMVLFIRKYAENFGFSIFLFLAFATYAFTMAAMKQTMATAIAIWAVPFLLNKKRFRAVLLILVAMFIHPYVVVYFAVFFLYKNIWDKKAVIIMILTVVISFSFTTFLSGLLNLTSLIGEEYELSRLEGNGVSIFRIIVYWISPVLSFIFREKIRAKENKFLNVCVNVSFVAACFIFLANFGNGSMMGRLANYYDIFTCISLPIIISCGFPTQREKIVVTTFVFAGFIGYYIAFYSKYYPDFFGSMFSDWYAHVSIFALFRG